MNFIKQKCITAAVLLLVAILSITVVGKYVSAPENHQKTIASLAVSYTHLTLPTNREV